MAEGALTDRIRNFVEHYVFAVEHLEVMLLLEATPETVFTADEVYSKILSSRGSITAWLETMVEHGLASKNGAGGQTPTTYQFAPRTPELREYMQELAQVYGAYPVRVIEVIYHPGRRQHSQDPAQSFANAFKFRQHP
ncbi:hypothetical protein [Verrucomicrobium spinosum]|uniref:hypothetical protein n=1 Tax=Verrucomicrobium spinosum TaxID=2736 RepID=UPI000174538B|nr:hypothetical protein [Verrucomicrobium spinosum]